MDDMPIQDDAMCSQREDLMNCSDQVEYMNLRNEGEIVK